MFLDESVRYYDSGSETVRQHVLRALDYTLAHMSERGIPLIMAADWNDGLDYVGRQGRGESSMVAAHLAWMLRETASLLWFVGSDPVAQKYVEERDKLVKSINQHLWDGEWYIRGTRDDGEAIRIVEEYRGADLPQRAIVDGDGRGGAEVAGDAVHGLRQKAPGYRLRAGAYSCRHITSLTPRSALSPDSRPERRRTAPSSATRRAGR